MVQPSGWFAVQLRYAYLAGQPESATMVEDRVVLVDGEDEEAALGRAVEMAPEYEDDFETDDGEPGSIRFEGIVAIKELDDPPAAGTEVWHEFMDPTRRGRVRRPDGRCRLEPLPPVYAGGDGLSPRPRRLSSRQMSAWRRTAYRAARPLLFAFDAEAIHHTTLDLLAPSGRRLPALCRLASGVGAADAARDPVEVIGLRFRNRVGLGAGFDKDGVAHRGLGGARVRVRRARHRHAACRRRGIRGRGSPACRATGRSSTGWASTTPAPRRCAQPDPRCAAAAARRLRRRRQHRPQPRR